MTNLQAQTEFKIRLDKMDSLNYPNLTVVEIDSLLNQAYERIVKQRYGLTNVKRQSFEETQKRTEDLKNLVLNTVISPSANASDNIDTNAQFVTLPTDYWFSIQERAEVNYQDCNNQWKTILSPVYPIQHNEFNKFISSPFKKPSKDRVLRLMENGRIELVHAPNDNLVTYRLRYIKKPLVIDTVNSPSTNLEASDHLQSEIIEEAVRIALETIESKRTNSIQPVLNTQE